jgi:hypothetical protein
MALGRRVGAEVAVFPVDNDAGSAGGFVQPAGRNTTWSLDISRLLSGKVAELPLSQRFLSRAAQDGQEH